MRLSSSVIESDIKTGIRAANWAFNIGEKSEISLEEVLLKWTLLAHEYTDDFLKAFHTVIERDFPNLALRPAKAALCASFLLARVVFDSEKALDELERLTSAEYGFISYTQVLEGLALASDALGYAELYDVFQDKLKDLYKEICCRMPLATALRDFVVNSPLVTDRKEELVLELAFIPETAAEVRKLFEEIPFDEIDFFLKTIFSCTYDVSMSRLCSFLASVKRTDFVDCFFESVSVYRKFPKVQDCKILLKSYLEAGGSLEQLLDSLGRHLHFQFLDLWGLSRRFYTLSQRSVMRRILIAVRGLFGLKALKKVLTSAMDADNFEEALRKLAAEYPGFLYSWELSKLRKDGVFFDCEAII